MEVLKPIVLYRNPAVVRRIQLEHGLNESDAEALFEDTKRFLALSVITDEEISPTGLIDKGWHEFLMFTHDYAEFCYTYLGKFVHHVPFGPDDESGAQKAERAVELARHHFGDLSENWSLCKAVGNCAPTPNCEAPPADCALNTLGQQFGWPTRQQAAAVSP